MLSFSLLLSKSNSILGNSGSGAVGFNTSTTLLSISLSGLFSSDDILYDGPLSFLTPNHTSDWTYFHNILHYILYILIGTHISAILYYQIVKKMKIIERILDGYSRIEKINIVSINEKPLKGILILLISTILPVLILIYFN